MPSALIVKIPLGRPRITEGVTGRPTLVVSGPGGAGKTTLAHGDAPGIEVDTTDGYAPGLDRIVAFVNGR